MQQRSFIFLYFALLLASIVGGASQARASDGPWLKTDFAEARLISAAETWQLKDKDMIWPAALEVQLKPGWKIYWRSPGDAGLPTQFLLDETSSAGGYTTELIFPVPERFTLFDLETYGYGGRVILPLDIFVPAGRPAFVSGMLDLLACSDICVPMQGPISIDLAAGTGAPSPYAQDIAYARSQVPSKATGPNIQLSHIWFEAENNHIVIALTPGSLPISDIFIEGAGPGYSFSKPVQDEQTAYIDVSGKAVEELSGQLLTLTILAEDQISEIRMRLSAQDRDSVAGLVKLETNRDSIDIFWASLFVAFLGGVILNVMPCVLPVLSLKVASILSMAHASPQHIRQRFLASAAGIIISFIILALGLISIRAAGLQVGWGIQFQQPVFLGIMFVVLGLFTLSLFDRVNIPIPAFLSGLARTDGTHNLRGDFIAGMLATLLATPCSAPFVGTAVTFALTGSDGVLMLVMVAMAFGLASPWLIFAAKPGLVSYLPKPGHWMAKIKQFLGVLLLATTIWVGWLFAGAIELRDAKPPQNTNWQPWSVEALQTEMASGKFVLVDVTADWCITCKTNKLLVLDTKEGLEATKAANIVRLQADWTRPDTEIAAFLAQYGRYGIPFNIIFHENLEAPVILPEVLTLKTLENSIQTALSGAGS